MSEAKKMMDEVNAVLDRYRGRVMFFEIVGTIQCLLWSLRMDLVKKTQAADRAFDETQTNGIVQ